MATNIGNLQIKIGADIKELVDASNKSVSLLDKIKKSADFTALAGAFNIVKDALGGLSGIASDLINEFDQDAKAAQKLTTALHGNATAAKELLDQANLLQKTRLFPDEVTANASALLATMGFQNQAIKELIPKIQDFASAWGLDLNDAAKKVGKSIIDGGDALKKYGVTVKEGTTVAERFTNINNALAKSFDGQAEAAAKAGAGPLQILSQKFGEIKEKAGESLLAFVGVFLPAANDGVDTLSTVLADMPDKFRRIGEVVKTLLTPISLFFSLAEKARNLVDSIPGFSNKNNTSTNRSNVLDAPETQAAIAARKNISDNLALITNLKDLQSEFKKTSSTAENLVTREKELKRFGESHPFSPLINEARDLGGKINNIIQQAKVARDKLAFGDQGFNVDALPTIDKDRDISGKVKTDFKKAKDEVIELQTALQRSKAAGIEFSSQVSEAISGQLSNAFVAVGEAIGDAFSGDNFNTNGLLSVFASLLKQVGGIAIQLGVAILAIKLSLKTFNPVVAIAAGVALVALGSIIQNSIAKTVPRLARGGLAYTPTLAIVGDNPNARQDPEVVTPLSKLIGIIHQEFLAFAKPAGPDISSLTRLSLIPSLSALDDASRQSTVVDVRGRFEISGTDLVLALDRNRAISDRQTPRRL